LAKVLKSHPSLNLDLWNNKTMASSSTQTSLDLWNKKVENTGARLWQRLKDLLFPSSIALPKVGQKVFI